MCRDSEKNMSVYADRNHAPSLTSVRLEEQTGWKAGTQSQKELKSDRNLIMLAGCIIPQWK